MKMQIATRPQAAFSVALALLFIFSLALAFVAGFMVGGGGWPKTWPRPVVELKPPATTSTPAPAAAAKAAARESGEQKLEKILRQEPPAASVKGGHK